MKKGFFNYRSKFALVIILLLTSLNGFSQNSQPFSINESPLPAPTGPVMDYVGVLDAAAKQNLERRLIEFRDKTNPKVEMAVAIVNTTGERPIFDYSLAVARGWKIGSKEDDNPSLLLVVAINDRKAFVQVSKDLEDELPDGLVTSLQRQYLVPAFRQNNYGKGITDLFEAYIKVIESKQTGEPIAGATQQNKGEKSSSGGLCGTVVCLIILFVVLISIFSRFGSNKKRGGRGDDDQWRGGGFGGGTGGVLPWIIGSAIANSIGNSSSSSSGDWGGGSSGGDSWGGFGGGGDFGGGGGGSDW